MSGIYFDTAYVCKCYLNEVDADFVREIARSAHFVTTSSLCIAEFACAIQRNIREGLLRPKAALVVRNQFAEDAELGTWNLIAVTDRILWRVERMTRELPKGAPLRAGDAIHIATAVDQGIKNIWSNDRHLLAAAGHFGLEAKTVEPGLR